MMVMKLDLESVELAALGGAFLGGGGGGSMQEGRALGELAVKSGPPALVSLQDLPDDACIVTVSAVGSPASRESRLEPADYVRAVGLLQAGGIRIGGLITSENGGLATLNGWYQSAVLGIPVVDAACNGRAHPLGIMGSMGLHLLDRYSSVQALAGGNREKGRGFEATVSACLEDAAAIVRYCASTAGGLVAVARNPVHAGYVRQHGAPGAISQAIELGRCFRDAGSCGEAAKIVVRRLGGAQVAEGTVGSMKLETREGLDIGECEVVAASGTFILSFCNEFICMECDGVRLATFPDLIAALHRESGLPLTTAEIRTGMPVTLLIVPRERLNLGAGMRDPALFGPVEQMTGKELVKHL